MLSSTFNPLPRRNRDNVARLNTLPFTQLSVPPLQHHPA